jgi:hypothetical protein
MRVAILFSTAITLLTTISGFASKSQAIQLQDGTVYFAQPPRLLKASTTYNTIGVVGGTYYFTISLPENAGEPLQSIRINQHEGVDYIAFNLQDSFALGVVGTNKQQRLELKNTNSDKKTKTVTLTFDPPVSPGQTITIGLRPIQNPIVEGVYLFGVTAYPRGEKAHGQFLGFGRLHFYGYDTESFRFPYP